MSNKAKRGFHWSTKAFYSEILRGRRDIYFGLYHNEGGTTGEMCIEWKELNKKWVPRLQVFDDAWKVLNSFPDLLNELAKVDSKNITEEQFVEILLKCGFEDLTKYYRE